MKYKPNCDVILIADEYTKYNDFDNLYENFKTYIEKLDIGKNDDYLLYYDKYLLAAVVGCIEGNISIDTTNNSWQIWYGNYQISKKIDNKNKFPYILFSIYEFLKNNVKYYSFITKYYNLWHRVDKHENAEFSYDEYHILDMQDNYKQLITTMDMDIKNAGNKSDNYVIFSYEALCSVLIRLFDRPKMYR